jgi:intraflagellar transport protein 88
MTSVAGAGFSSKPGMGRFMEANSKALGPAPPLVQRADTSPEEQAKEMERRVHGLVESSAEAAVRGDKILALERAKEAGRKERALSKFRESNNMADAINMDLTFCVCFALANAVSRRRGGVGCAREACCVRRGGVGGWRDGR